MNDFRKEHLRHPREEEKSSGYNLPRRSTVVLVLLALGLAFFFLSANQRYEARDRELNDQLAQLINRFDLQGEQLEVNSQQMGLLVTDLQTVQKRVGVTQNEIKQARAVAKEIREKQQKDVQTLSSQLVTKADSKQVDAKFQEVDDQITGVQQEVQASRQEIEKTWEELSSLGLHVTEQGSLVATNADALEELRLRGERDYLSFDGGKYQKIDVGGIVLQLRKANHKKHYADVRLFYDDKQFDRKKVYTNTPLVFYVGKDTIQYELVINEVSKNHITGYISLPQGKSSPFQGLRRLAKSND